MHSGRALMYESQESIGRMERELYTAIRGGLDNVLTARCHNILNGQNATRWQLPLHPEHLYQTCAPLRIGSAGLGLSWGMATIRDKLGHRPLETCLDNASANSVPVPRARLEDDPVSGVAFALSRRWRRHFAFWASRTPSDLSSEHTEAMGLGTVFEGWGAC
jgi:hypothetical protein